MGADAPSVPIAPQPHAGYNLSKRALDIVGAFALLLLLAPLLLVIAVVLKLTSRGPLLFRQERYGIGGGRFMVWKFRTMVANAGEQVAVARALVEASDQYRDHGPAFKSEHDPRVTTFGRFLRRWSLDELPQLFNVLGGSMSFVGPRPLVREEVQELTPEQSVRHSVKPGITCIWQTSGRSRVPYDERMAMDIEYVSRRSLLTDLWLLVRTPFAIVSGDGAY